MGILKHIPFKLKITTLVKFNIPDICFVYKSKENKECDLKRRSPVKDLDNTSLHFESTLCVFGKPVSDVKDEKCCSVVFFTHTAGSSISGNISHSASLTPSSLLQCPHIFSILHFSPGLPPSLPPCLLSALWPLSPPLLLWFSNMPFHRMLPPVFFREGWYSSSGR